MPVPNFSWIREGILAASAQPQGLQDFLALRAEGIGAVVTLTEAPPRMAEIEEAGLKALHLPVVDFTPPTLVQVQTFVDFVNEQRRWGRGVLVHCTAGIGRSGTMIACFLAHEDRLSGDDAIRRARQQRPGSIETAEQENLVRTWAESLRSRREP